MKRILHLVSIVTIALGFLAVTAKASEQTERIEASYLLAFGRAPSPAEVAYWSKQGQLSVTNLVARHRQYLQQDAATKRAAIIKSYEDALGRKPSEAEIRYWSQSNNTYTELVKNHVQWLSGNPGEYENVIRRSYQRVLNRQPSPAEINYWRHQGTLSYVVLVGCHEQWKRSNSTKTSGTLQLAPNSGLLTTVSVSPSVAAEARSAAGVIAAGGGNVIAAGGGNVIAAGGGNVIAAGGGNVIAAGGGN